MTKVFDYDHIPTFEEMEADIYKSSDIPTKCLSCGFTENVPDFIYGECSSKKFYFKFNKSIPTLQCNRCGHNAIPTSYLK